MLTEDLRILRKYNIIINDRNNDQSYEDETKEN